MRIIKLGLISLIVFSIILYLFSLLLPSHVRISRAINIYADKSVIHSKISDFKSWSEWNTLINNNIEIKQVSSDSDNIATSWHYKANTLNNAFLLEESANITVVQWYFDFKLKWYPGRNLEA